MKPLLIAIVVGLAGCQAVRTPDRTGLVAEYAEPASRFVSIEGMDVHLTDEGRGPVLLMLHGTAASLHTWEEWSRELQRDYRVLRIDLPPFGLTGPHPEHRYDPEGYRALVEGVLDHAGAEEAVLVGSSLGGYVAANFAAAHPERVVGLVLVSPAGYPQSLPWAIRIMLVPVVGRLAVHVTPRWVVARGVRSVYGDPDRIEPGTVDRYFDLVRAPGAREGFRRLAGRMDELREEEPEWTADIEAPTLLVWGEDDEFTPVELAELWMDDLSDARLVVLPGVGHIAMEEAPKRSLAVVRPFLDALHEGTLSASPPPPR